MLVLPSLTPTKLKHGLNADTGEAKLPGRVLLVTDTLIEHYWATIRRHVRRRNTTDRRNKRILAWDALVHIGRAIKELAVAPKWRTLDGSSIDLRTVADAFMRAVPSYNVTLPRFLSSLHFLFGLRVAPEVVLTSKLSPSMRNLKLEDRKKHLVDRPLLRAVNDYFEGFDLDSTGTIDWRDLICRLSPFMKPMWTPQQHLLFCFELFTADQAASSTKRAAIMSKSIQHPHSSSSTSSTSSSKKPETTLRISPKRSSKKKKDYAALLRSPPRIHPELPLRKACQICSLYATTEILELRMFDIARKAYENLNVILRQVREGSPIVTSIGFREMLTVDMSDSARAIRSDSARNIALRKYSHPNSENDDDDDDGLGTDEDDGDEDKDQNKLVMFKNTGQHKSPWSNISTSPKKKKMKKTIPTLGSLMAPCREVAMKGMFKIEK